MKMLKTCAISLGTLRSAAIVGFRRVSFCAMKLNLVLSPSGLPTAPVSMQYASAFSSGNSLTSNIGPPAAVRTLASAIPGQLAPTAQTIVHNLQQQLTPVVTTLPLAVHPKPATFSSTPARPVSATFLILYIRSKILVISKLERSSTDYH